MTRAAEGAFERWTSVSELWAAAHRAARSKRRRTAVARFLFELEGQLLELEDALRSDRWRPSTPMLRRIRDPKPRIIAVSPFVDRVVHQAVCGYIGPLLERSLIHDTYACRVGRGTHAALRRAARWARAYEHFVHLDVRKLFPSIDHATLVRQLERAIPCGRTLAVLRRIVSIGEDLVTPRFHFPGDDLLTPAGRPQGLPIGSLTSQHFANGFLSPIDHRIKDRLRVRGYLRYMDDMLLFGDDPGRVRAWAHAVEDAAARLRLRLHAWQVRPTRLGVNFLGFRILPGEIRVRRTSVRRAERHLGRALRLGDPRVPERLRAVFAHWQYADSYRLRTRLLRRLGVLADEQGEDGAAFRPGDDDGREWEREAERQGADGESDEG